MLKTIITLALLAALAAPVAAGQARAGAPQAGRPSPPPPPKPMPKADVGPGRLEGDSFAHDYFGISFTIPQDWVVQSADDKLALMNEGARLTESTAGERQKAQIAAATQRTNFLLGLFKYAPSRPAADFNAHLAFMVERVPTAVVKTGADYMNMSLMTLRSTGAKMEPVGPVRTETLGGAAFAATDVRMTLPTGAVAQKFYATVRRGYALIFIYSYSDEGDLETFEEVLQSVRFK